MQEGIVSRSALGEQDSSSFLPSDPRGLSPHDDAALSSVHRLFAPLFDGWRERHYARRTSRELLALYRRVRTNHPGLTGLPLYRMVVADHLGGESSDVDAVLEHAKDSFATWPVDRPLTFRDIVHYVAVSNFLEAHDAAPWTQSNLGRMIAARIPQGL